MKIINNAGREVTVSPKRAKYMVRKGEAKLLTPKETTNEDIKPPQEDTVDELAALKKEAKELGVKGYALFKKETLIKKIKELK